MKSYDDLQRFKEKTQTNHIEFKDMSEQTRNADNTDWAIIRQLMNEGAASALGNGQRTDITAPQPAADLFNQSAIPALPQKSVTKISASPATGVAAFVTAKPVAQGGSLLDSIAASLKPTAQAQSVLPESLRAAEVLQATPFEKSTQLDTMLAPQTASRTEAARVSPTSSLLDAVRSQQPASSINTAAHSQQPASPLDTMLAPQTASRTEAARVSPTSSLLDAVRSQQPASPVNTAAPSQQPASPLDTAARSPQPASPLDTAVRSQQPASPLGAARPAEPERFKQLFSASGPRDATLLPKETLLQPLLERIASCR
ncbi:cellulose biosynthesis protein BcsO [Erwinia sp. BNK-24-b]|uniref:cellulose biosynthesis protein BcsO n=1 Tax=unclassified Erwinia TaxID=2622719 RepID=UPI0039BECFF8